IGCCVFGNDNDSHCLVKSNESDSYLILSIGLPLGIASLSIALAAAPKKNRPRRGGWRRRGVQRGKP
ncbi:hypothetical protein, partial [Bordetella pseudohinzii]|uniref:hypothetical protein n=1 Tax=Bordetella pseudohinzii TaxID=1331258 RepID=UPI001F280C31